MLARLGDRLAAFFRATAPDPFAIAVLLTALTFVLVLIFGTKDLDGARVGLSVTDVVGFWASDGGVWKFLAFSMQMCLILVTGHAVASSPPVAKMIHALAALPRTGGQAAALVALVAASLGVFNWGLGLIGGALIARDVGRAMERRGIRVHYPVLAAAGYVGLMVWHGGLSGTAPLKVTKQSEIDSIFAGTSISLAPMPLSETIFSPMNFIITGGLIVIATVVMWRLMPTHGEVQPISDFMPEPEKAEAVEEDKPWLPRVMEDTPLINVLLCAMIAWWAWGYYALPEKVSEWGGFRLGPNEVNLTMLMLGLLLHGTPRRYVRAIDDAARGCAGIILQFPLYAGIMGMMHASGLTEQLAEGIASIGSSSTLPIFTFLSAGIVNLFIPSGGGQWGVQGPIVMSSAHEAGIEPSKMLMALAYGDQMTNMLQPFWALPLLAITGVKAREIVGYTALLMLLASIWVIGCLLVF